MFKIFLPIVNHSLQYNPALDGVRGVAIALVVLFHIWPQYFSLGYIGVDIFFALSGFLITQIIYRKLEENRFNFKKFYRNRIRRILPAVIIVLLFTLFVGYLFLFSSELKSLGHHVKSSAFFYQNFRLIGEVGYWDEAAKLKPLLHFWSLSIEEQFYLFWPLIVFVIYKLKFNLFYALLFLAIVSFSFSFLLNIDQFYHSLARFWELILGGVLYALSERINVSLHFFKKILSIQPLVFLGLISFPLYLWHYVFVSYIHIFSFDLSKYGFVIVFVSIFISYITYRYVEMYARKQTSYKFAFLLFTVLIGLGFLGKYIYISDGLKSRQHLVANEKFKKQFIRTPAKNELGIELTTKILGYKLNNDYIKATSSDIKKDYMVVIGDSHAHTSYPGFAQEFKARGYESLLIANSSCPPYLGGAMGKNIKDLKLCQKKIDNIYKVLNSNLNVKKIILATRMGYMYDIGYGVVDDGGKPWNYHFLNYFTNRQEYNQKEIFIKVIQKTFENFNENTQYEFYYLLENPELGFSPKNCMVRPFDVFPQICRLPLNLYLKRAGEYRSKVGKISEKYPNVRILDPKNLYCDNLYCYAIKDDKMLYADDDHHSLDGSDMQAKYFMKDIIHDF